jgi:hypothetical protein
MFALRALLSCLVVMLKATDATTLLALAGLAQR